MRGRQRLYAANVLAERETFRCVGMRRHETMPAEDLVLGPKWKSAFEILKKCPAARLEAAGLWSRAYAAIKSREETPLRAAITSIVIAQTPSDNAGRISSEIQRCRVDRLQLYGLPSLSFITIAHVEVFKPGLS